MSLKAFHIAFIVVAVATLLGLALWAINEYRWEPVWWLLPTAGLSVLTALGLIVYARDFLRKMTALGYRNTRSSLYR